MLTSMVWRKAPRILQQMALGARRDTGIDPTAKISAEQSRIFTLCPPFPAQVLGFGILQITVLHRFQNLLRAIVYICNKSHLNTQDIEIQGLADGRK